VKLAAIFSVAFLCACRTDTGASVDASGDGADEALSFVFADAEPSASTSADDHPSKLFDESRLALYAHATPRTGKSIGHTSVVFRLDFETDAGALRAAYKPESKRGHKRFRGEVAAYRLAKLLAIPNVPPATVRIFARDALRNALHADGRAAALESDEVIERSGHVFGALVPWIDRLEFTPIESPVEMARWKAELTNGGDLPADRRALAAQISTLVVFDALTGNWDRWSGANVGLDKKTNTLLFVDNDAAFFDPIPPAFAPQMALVRSVDRFSRALVSKLRTTDAIMLADAFGDEEPGTPLLPARVVAACDQRRKDVLAIIGEKIAKLGEANVLFFP
jgi:hypothetical protein